MKKRAAVTRVSPCGARRSRLVALPTVGAAQDKPDGGEHHWPNPEAIAACKDKKEADSCEFDAPRGRVAGTCRKVKSGDMACVHPHHHHDEGSGG